MSHRNTLNALASRLHTAVQQYSLQFLEASGTPQCRCCLLSACRSDSARRGYSVLVVAAGAVLVVMAVSMLVLVLGDLGLDLVHVQRPGLADQLLEIGGPQRPG